MNLQEAIRSLNESSNPLSKILKNIKVAKKAVDGLDSSYEYDRLNTVYNNLKKSLEDAEFYIKHFIDELNYHKNK